MKLRSMRPVGSRQSSVGARVLFVASGLAIGAGIGCQSPVGHRRGDPRVDRSLAYAIDREIETLDDQAPPLITTQPPAAIEETLGRRRQELDELSPATDPQIPPLDLGPDLRGEVQEVVAIDLESTVRTAVANNLSVRIASLQPAINAQDVISAEAAFDWVLFASADLSKLDQPSPSTVISGVGPVSPPFTNQEAYRFETGVRKRLESGGELQISADTTRFRNNAAGVSTLPDPAYTSALRLGVTQPLLRGFGSDVNTATIRFAANTEQRAMEVLRRDLLVLVEETEAAYWQLVFSWREREIREWLVTVGEQVRDVLDRRRDFDTKLAQYADAVARVERRKSDVIRAQRRVRGASDRLKVLMNDAGVTIGSEAVLKPTEAFKNAPIAYDVRETILAALENRPEIRIALLTIDDSQINKLLADNARLPLLNVSAEVAFTGLDDNFGDSFGNSFSDQFVDYVVGMFFEYPLGNRGPEAEYRRSRLERTQAVAAYRQTVQDVVFDVKSALRDVITNFELIQATRATRVAAAENLRTLLVEEETLAGLTPEFLDLKFRRQDSLAEARALEFDALAAFDTALASLNRAMGIGLDRRGIAVEVARDLGPDDGAYEEFGPGALNVPASE